MQYPENARLFGHEEDGCTDGLDYYAKDIYIRDGMQHFTYVWPQGQIHVVIRQLGMHNVNNAVVAMAIAMEYGLDAKTAAEGLLAYEGIPMRQQINHLRDGIKVIDDTYNASPDSIKSGVTVLGLLDNPGRKIAVLADVLELGDMSWQCHYDTGCFVAESGVDEVVTVGQEMKALVQAVNEHAPQIVTHNFLKMTRQPDI